MLKDDKSYPFLVLTKEEFPRIMYTRHPTAGSSRWGPFPNAGAAKQVMQLLRRQFGIRDCKELLPQGCLSMHIGLCSGPCISGEGYSQSVDAARRILNGDAVELLEEFAGQMDVFSHEMQFEKAAQSRDMIRAIRATTGQHVVSSKVYRDCDALGIAVQGDLAAIVVIHANNGIVQGQEVWPMLHRGDCRDTVSMFVSEHYTNRTPPRLLLSPELLDDGTEEWLTTRTTKC